MNDSIRNILDAKDRIISRLMPAEKLVNKVRGMKAERIADLAAAGYIPHWRVDGGEPLFDAKEVRAWVQENLVAYNPGQPLPTHFCLTADVEYPVQNKEDLPVELRNVYGLTDVTGILSLQSGIYFLCLDNRVVYVGQSKKASSRVINHLDSKDFNKVLFLRWPAFDLDRAEGAMIRLLKPPLNGISSEKPKKEAQPKRAFNAPGRPQNDAAFLEGITINGSDVRN